MFVLGHHSVAKQKGIEYDVSTIENVNKYKIVWYTQICGWCNEKYATRAQTSVYCSKACFHEWLRDGNANKDREYTRATNREWERLYDTSDSPYGKGRVKTHILNMEKYIGRQLNNQEVVHHIDQDKRNNHISNLYLFHCDNCHRFHHLTLETLEYKYEMVHAKGQIGPIFKTKKGRDPYKEKNTPMYENDCLNCGEKTVTKYKNRKFCNIACRDEYQRGANHPHTGRRKYTRTCPGCNIEFGTSNKRQEYCGKECYNKWAVGENHPKYKTGKYSRVGPK